MVISPTLRQLLADHNSLLDYSQGREVDFAAVRRRLVLAEREMDTRLPDHYYQRGAKEVLRDIASLPDLLSVGLKKLAGMHLTFDQRRVCVKVEALNDWQEVLTFCPPLPLVAALLHQRYSRQGLSPAILARFMGDFIQPNVRHTAMPSPRFPEMEQFRREGFHDLHAHLTGTVETDSAWQHFLKSPLAVAKLVRRGIRESEKAKEQWETECPGVEGDVFLCDLLFSAIRIRRAFVHVLFSGCYTPELDRAFKGRSVAEIMRNGSRVDRQVPSSTRHPMARVFSSGVFGECEWSDECLEGLMYVLLIDRLAERAEADLAALFHHYLLILGLVNRFLVQQVRQFGFDQFQKITHNEFRSKPEEEFSQRFSQLHGNDLTNLKVLEARFSPKGSVADTIKLLNKIITGWESFRWECLERGGRVPKLRLVAHFIKERDKARLGKLPRFTLRHAKLRHELWVKAWSLVGAWENDPKLRAYLAGVDAASNELETPPEVFAPVFRFLRRRGVKHFTYHAGEDFHHLVGGLRAIYEAVEFLGMARGDRIGHGTAAGIDPKLWLAHVGKEFPMSRGEWLDDMLFAFHLLIENPDGCLEGRLARLRSKISECGRIVYGNAFTVDELVKAWELRRFCPMHLLARRSAEVPTALWNREEWEESRSVDPGNTALEVVRRYHREDCRKRYHEKVRVGAEDIFRAEDMVELQTLVLKTLHEKEVVIETLPTSNVRISFYKDLDQHHMWRWLDLPQGSGFKVAPPIVMGTDDAGIFATNIYNEYCQVYSTLLGSHKLNHQEARRVVETLERNADTYAFTPGPLENRQKLTP